MQNEVEKLIQIENDWLWDSYANQKQRMSFKNRGFINERLLFHERKYTWEKLDLIADLAIKGDGDK